MRNKYHGACYRCGRHCKPGEGHYERHKGKWRHQHADCAVKYRRTDVHFQTNPINENEAFHLLDIDGRILKEYATAGEALKNLPHNEQDNFQVGIKRHHTLTIDEFADRYKNGEGGISNAPNRNITKQQRAAKRNH